MNGKTVFLSIPNWPWLAGVVIIFATALFYLGERPRIRTENTADKIHLRSLQDSLNVPEKPGGSRLLKVSAEDSSNHLNTVADDMQVLSVQHGLTLTDVMFRPSGDMVDHTVGLFEINAHLKGGYPALKEFLGALLDSHDGLALESLSIRRGRTTDLLMDVDLRLTYFYLKRA